MTNTTILNNFITDYCERVDISLDVLKSRSRKRNIVERRMVIAHVLRNRVGLTLKQAGNCINKDHATVIHYNKAIENFLVVYPHIKVLYSHAVQSYEKFKIQLHSTYDINITKYERETKLVDILLGNQEKLKQKINNLEKALYGKEK